MPGRMAVDSMSSRRTVVPFLAGSKTLVDQIGSVMSPAAGGVTEGSGRMSYSGWPTAAAAASPRNESVTVLWKSSLREIVVVGPSYGVIVVDGRVISTGGLMEKSGISMTVPS